MNQFVPVAIFGFPAVVLVLFAFVPARTAVLTSMLGAWMFLPIAGFKLAPGIPDVTKMSVTCLSVVMCAAVFDARRFSTLRWSVLDSFILVWVLCPIPSAVSSGYGLYEGFSLSFGVLVAWGLPYLIGRLYFCDQRGLSELALALVIAGLVYMPFVLFEVRMSPQLHTWVYGFHQHDFGQSKRGGGWRPTVFMQHGLAVALFMATAAISAFWLWLSGASKVIWRVPIWAVSAGLIVTTVLCKSSGASILMIAACGALVIAKHFRAVWPIVGLSSLVPTYIGSRMLGLWDAGVLVRWAGAVSDREDSLLSRLRSEDILLRAIGGHSWLGLGRLESVYGSVEEGEKFIPDALWVISFAKTGLLGLTALFGVLLVPVVAFSWRWRTVVFRDSSAAPAVALAVVLVIYALDCLMNAMPNPIYTLIAGGLVAASMKAGSTSTTSYGHRAGAIPA